MLLDSPALDKVIAEFGSQEKIAKFNRDVRTALLEAGMSVGYSLFRKQVEHFCAKLELYSMQTLFSYGTLLSGP
ncbi:MAG: hypothetical protein EBE86_012545 [Hormoscilla sp. GUM202]|nr:hypothetical protein [Hormoscilla sp. GUM202]